MAWGRRNLPVVVLGGALSVAALMLVAAGRHFTFFQDSFDFLLYRRSWNADSFLTPWNEHIVAIPVLITKVLLAVFGMSSSTPEQIFMGLTVLAAPVLLFVWMRRRIDPWLALILGVLFLFLGSAWPVTLWPFEDFFTLPVVFGLAMLLLLEREDAKGDAWACAMLVAATLSSTLGLSFIIAAFVDFLLHRRTRGWSRAYVFAVPLLLFVAWYLGWGHEAERHLTLSNVLASPAYVAEGLAAALAALTGLNGPTAVGGPTEIEWGKPLLVAAVALVAFGQWRRPGVSRRFWTVAAAGGSYWLLAAFNVTPGREASSGRYTYVCAFFALLIIVELLAGLRFSRRALIIIAVAALLAIGPNLAQMQTGSAFLREQSVFTRADLAALEISRNTVDPAFTLGSQETTGTASLGLVGAGSYFEAVDRWGSPAYSVAELEKAPPVGRHFADLVLAAALPIDHKTVPGFEHGTVGRRCVTMPAGHAADKEVPVSGDATVELAPGPSAPIALRRFAEGEFPVAVATAEGGTTTAIEIPADRAKNPWFVHVEAGQLARVCV
ncbi:MAG TPA: hypothetical protein VGH14_18470 [Solirubrobacterales bacterium]|jgi:hypothetical protein